MREKITAAEAIRTLRTADASSLFYYSQHIAEVVETLLYKADLLASLLRSLDDLETSEMGQPLSAIRISAKVQNETLHGLLKEIAAIQLDSTDSPF
jgi:hypothetical protein